MKRSNSRMTVLLLGSLLVGLTGCAEPVQLSTSLTHKQTSLRALAAPADYYGAAQGKVGKDLLAALAGIVKNHKDLGYNGARNVMFGSLDDYQDNDQIECVYTGRVATKISDTSSASTAKLNTEHSWPQSLGAEGPAKADLNHLFPTDMDTNGARSSFPFGEVKSAIQSFPEFDVNEGTSRLGTDSQGNQVFEPRGAHKGNLARALMYFYTCYGANGRTSMKNFRIERNVLLTWNKLDPVDEAE
ncbi:MAG TPA: endonuclease, partial [Chroococcales cyanobacterium]